MPASASMAIASATGIAKNAPRCPIRGDEPVRQQRGHDARAAHRRLPQAQVARADAVLVEERLHEDQRRERRRHMTPLKRMM